MLQRTGHANPVLRASTSSPRESAAEQCRRRLNALRAQVNGEEMSIFRFIYYPEVRLEWRGGWPPCPNLAAVPADKTGSVDGAIARSVPAAAAWAAEQGLPTLVGKAEDVQTAEVFRAEWLRQGFSDHGVLRREATASSWLSF